MAIQGPTGHCGVISLVCFVCRKTAVLLPKVVDAGLGCDSLVLVNTQVCCLLQDMSNNQAISHRPLSVFEDFQCVFLCCRSEQGLFESTQEQRNSGVISACRILVSRQRSAHKYLPSSCSSNAIILHREGMLSHQHFISQDTEHEDV